MIKTLGFENLCMQHENQNENPSYTQKKQGQNF